MVLTNNRKIDKQTKNITSFAKDVIILEQPITVNKNTTDA